MRPWPVDNSEDHLLRYHWNQDGRIFICQWQPVGSLLQKLRFGGATKKGFHALRTERWILKRIPVSRLQVGASASSKLCVIRAKVTENYQRAKPACQQIIIQTAYKGVRVSLTIPSERFFETFFAQLTTVGLYSFVASFNILRVTNLSAPHDMGFRQQNKWYKQFASMGLAIHSKTSCAASKTSQHRLFYNSKWANDSSPNSFQPLCLNHYRLVHSFADLYHLLRAIVKSRRTNTGQFRLPRCCQSTHPKVTLSGAVCGLPSIIQLKWLEILSLALLPGPELTLSNLTKFGNKPGLPVACSWMDQNVPPTASVLVSRKTSSLSVRKKVIHALYSMQMASLCGSVFFVHPADCFTETGCRERQTFVATSPKIKR